MIINYVTVFLMSTESLYGKSLSPLWRLFFQVDLG